MCASGSALCDVCGSVSRRDEGAFARACVCVCVACVACVASCVCDPVLGGLAMCHCGILRRSSLLCNITNISITIYYYFIFNRVVFSVRKGQLLVNARVH